MDAWENLDGDRPLLGGLYGKMPRVRMFAFGLRGGGVCVVSPGGEPTPERREPLDRLGGPRFFLAPNHFHNAGLRGWQAAYPQARVVAHPRAIPRLRRQAKGVEIGDLAALEAELPPDVRLFGPPMARQGETWVSLPVSDGRAWFVTDGVLNESELPGGFLGVVAGVVGFKTELMTNPLFKRLFLTDKAAYKQWMLDELRQDAPTVFVPSHGAILRGPDVADRLREVTGKA